MSSIPLHPLAEYIYNILLLIEDGDPPQYPEGKIRYLKKLANNIHAYVRMVAGSSLTRDNISIPCSRDKVRVILHQNDGKSLVILDVTVGTGPTAAGALMRPVNEAIAGKLCSLALAKWL